MNEEQLKIELEHAIKDVPASDPAVYVRGCVSAMIGIVAKVLAEVTEGERRRQAQENRPIDGGTF